MVPVKHSKVFTLFKFAHATPIHCLLRPMIWWKHHMKAEIHRVVVPVGPANRPGFICATSSLVQMQPTLTFGSNIPNSPLVQRLPSSLHIGCLEQNIRMELTLPVQIIGSSNLVTRVWFPQAWSPERSRPLRPFCVSPLYSIANTIALILLIVFLRRYAVVVKYDHHFLCSIFFYF